MSERCECGYPMAECGDDVCDLCSSCGSLTECAECVQDERDRQEQRWSDIDDEGRMLYTVQFKGGEHDV